MLGILRRKVAKSQFEAAYTAALDSPDMNERVEAADFALSLVDKLRPWPLPRPTRSVAIGKLHGARGIALTRSAWADPPGRMERAIESFAEAEKHLRREDGADWAFLRMNLAIAFADRMLESRAENLERAITVLEAALPVVDRHQEPQLWAEMRGNLGAFYKERLSGSPADNVKRSIALHEEILSVFTRHDHPLEWAKVQTNLGIAWLSLPGGDRSTNVEKAIKTMEGALGAMRENGATDKDLAWVNSQLAVAYGNRVLGESERNIERALEANEAALRVFSEAETPRDWAGDQINRGNLFRQRIRGPRAANLEQAISSYKAALRVFTRERDSYHYAQCRANLGAVMEERIDGDPRANLDCAVEDYRAAVAVFDRDSHSVDWARAQCLLASALVELPGQGRAANVEAAIEAAESAESVLDPKERPREWARAKMYLGNALVARAVDDPAKNLERSIRELKESLAVLGRDSDPDDWATVQGNLATAYLQRIKGSPADNVEEAISRLEAALEVLSRAGYPRERAAELVRLGNAYVARSRSDAVDNVERALVAYAEAEEISRREDDPLAWAVLKQNQGCALLNHPEKEPINHPDREGSGKVQQSIDALEEALEVLTPLDHRTSWILTQVSLGTAYSRLPAADAVDFARNLDRSIEAYEAALTLATREADPWKWAGIKKNVAIAFEMLREVAVWVGASDFIADLEERSANALRESLEVLTLAEAPREHVNGALLLGMSYLRRRDWPAAEAAFTSVQRAADLLIGIDADELDAGNTLQSLGGFTANAPLPSLMLGSPERALALLEASRAQFLAKALRLEVVPLSVEERVHLRNAQYELAVIDRRLDSAVVIDRASLLKRKASARRQIKDLLRPHLPEAADREEEVRRRVTACTCGGSVIVAPVLTQEGSKIILGLGRNGQSELRVVDVDTDGQSLELLSRTLERLTEACRAGGRSRMGETSRDLRLKHRGESPIWKEIGTALWELFAGKLVSALDAAGVSRGARVVVLPQGGLGLLPLGLACNVTSCEMLIERYELSLSPNLAALARAQERAAQVGQGDSIVALANPEGRLPYTVSEVTLAQSWFPARGRHLIRGGATRRAALEFLVGKGIWHFATHGEFEESDPSRSGLELPGGERLTLASLLQARTLGTARLALLSACSTGIYDTRSTPSELAGLPVGFLQVGVAGVIATLWPVEDRSAALLVGRFYDFFLGEGKRPAAALREAQLWLKTACRSDIHEKVHAWKAQGRLGETDSASLAGQPSGAESGEVPFAHPLYWSGFVHYGA